MIFATAKSYISTYSLLLITCQNKRPPMAAGNSYSRRTCCFASLNGKFALRSTTAFCEQKSANIAHPPPRRRRVASVNFLPLPKQKDRPWRPFCFVIPFQNRSEFFGRWIDLSRGDDGSCTRPLSSGVLLHARKRIYVIKAR